MTSETSAFQKILTPLTFNRAGFKSIGEDESSTFLAVVIVSISALLDGMLSLQHKDSQMSLLMGSVGIQQGEYGALIQFLLILFFKLLLLFFFSFTITVFLKLFGGKQAHTGGTFRVICFVAIWLILETLLALFLSFQFPLLFFLLYVASLIFGIHVASETGVIRTILAIILGIIFGFLLFFGVLIGLAFMNILRLV